jgi:3-methyladenine DNA glycosylase AlkC
MLFFAAGSRDPGSQESDRKLPMLLKDMFNRQFVDALVAAIQREYPAFDREAFSERVFDAGWKARELKQRMRHITMRMHDSLPANYHAALDILQRALPSLSGYGFEKMVFPDYVEAFGLDDWEASIAALEKFTQRISAEFAIRSFINRQQDRTMAQMYDWAEHDHPGVRRLASEGCRPRLPWGMHLPALKADPAPILPILEQLKQDESESVRRSVANNLNDISKDHPDVVINVLRRWQAHDTEPIRWITSHALRTLLKQGHPEALDLLGYLGDPAIDLRDLTVEPEVVPLGGMVTFSFEIQSLSDQSQDLMIDFVAHLIKANGKPSPKVFKLTKKTLKAGQAVQITKSFSFKAITTRRYYPGEQAIEPKINGKSFGRVTFVLTWR